MGLHASQGPSCKIPQVLFLFRDESRVRQHLGCLVTWVSKAMATTTQAEHVHEQGLIRHVVIGRYRSFYVVSS